MVVVVGDSERENRSAEGGLRKLRESLPLSKEGAVEAAELIKLCSNTMLVEMGLGPPPIPTAPKDLDRMPIRHRVKAVQNFISSFRYNYYPGYHFNVNKQRSFARIMDTARDMLRDMLPIKCIEAVFIGMYLTCGWVGIDRLPISFKTTCNGQVYRHIVLLIHHRATRRYGVLGISRRDNLMYKDVAFKSLSEIVAEFKDCYKKWNHKLVKVHVGLSAEHNPYSTGPVCWRCCTLSIMDGNWEMVCATLDDYGSKVNQIQEKYRITGNVSDFAEKCY